MSDFEDRLGRALGEGAQDAPGAVGLAEGARVRARRRRTRRVAVGAAAVVLAVVAPIALVTSGSGPDERGTDDVADEGRLQQEVTCGGDATWSVATMADGLTGVVDDDEVRAAFADVLEEAPLDAPTAVRKQGAEGAEYVVLAAEGDSYTLGVGPWSIEGPSRAAMSATVERQADGDLRMTGWGDCQLTSVLPLGRSLVEVSAPDGGVDPATTTPVVMVTERQCASARDPEPFLGEPTIVADNDRVLVVMTSAAVVGGADCPGNPIVPLTLSLDEPIGDRELLDAGTFPPTPIEVAPPAAETAEAWQTVTYEGDPVNESGDRTVLVDLPPEWEQLDTSGCEFADRPRFGLVGGDPCENPSTVTLFPEAIYDSCCPPGLVDDASTSGYVIVEDLAVQVVASDYETARRILASVRLPGDRVPSATWRTDDLEAATVEVPDDDSVSVDLIAPSGVPSLSSQSARRDPGGTWTALVARGSGGATQITAPTQALADVVASTVRAAG